MNESRTRAKEAFTDGVEDDVISVPGVREVLRGVPTLTVLNLLLGDLLAGLPMILRTFILVTIAVPIVIYGAMPQSHTVRRALLARHPR